LPKTVTSISIDQDLWKAAKKFAIDRDITISELLEMSLNTFIKHPPEGKLKLAASLSATARSDAAKQAWHTRSQHQTQLELGSKKQ
jgi:hypothetical protein